jgi:hypothetical protein
LISDEQVQTLLANMSDKELSALLEKVKQKVSDKANYVSYFVTFYEQHRYENDNLMFGVGVCYSLTKEKDSTHLIKFNSQTHLFISIEPLDED